MSNSRSNGYRVYMLQSQWHVENAKNTLTLRNELSSFLAENSLAPMTLQERNEAVTSLMKKGLRVIDGQLIRFDTVTVTDFHRDCTCCDHCTCSTNDCTHCHRGNGHTESKFSPAHYAKDHK